MEFPDRVDGASFVGVFGDVVVNKLLDAIFERMRFHDPLVELVIEGFCRAELELTFES